eukprot:3729492-Rhodomonas_salina.2
MARATGHLFNKLTIQLGIGDLSVPPPCTCQLPACVFLLLSRNEHASDGATESAVSLGQSCFPSQGR